METPGANEQGDSGRSIYAHSASRIRRWRSAFILRCGKREPNLSTWLSYVPQKTPSLFCESISVEQFTCYFTKSNRLSNHFVRAMPWVIISSIPISFYSIPHWQELLLELESTDRLLSIKSRHYALTESRDGYSLKARAWHALKAYLFAVP